MQELIYEALPHLGDNPDVFDLMEVIVDLTKAKYPTCSDEFLTILRSWEKICVPTGHRLAEPNTPCADLEGDRSVCVDDNSIMVCLTANSGLNTNYAIWTLIGQNSTSFESVGGMSGNSQLGGNCLQIYDIPDMPYYPQVMTLKLRIFDHFSNKYLNLSERIEIRGCDPNAPTCEDYYNNQNMTSYMEMESEILNKVKLSSQFPENERNLVVYDIMGNRIDIDQNEIKYTQSLRNRILIYTYWSKDGQLLETKKVFIR